MNEKVKTMSHFSFKSMLLTNKDSCNTQIIQFVNDTIFRIRFRVPGFGTGSGTLEQEPVPTSNHYNMVRELSAIKLESFFNRQQTTMAEQEGASMETEKETL